MAIKSAFSTGMNDDGWEGITEFPQNRTLYVDQFNDDGPITDEDREGYQVSGIGDAFEHYKPCIDIVLLNEDGESMNEHIVFRSVKDFEDEQLIKQSEFLITEQNRVETFSNIIRQLEKNKRLGEIIQNPESRKELKDTLTILIDELQQKKANEEWGQNACFLLMKDIIQGLEVMDPNRKSTKNLFLSDIAYIEIKQQLQNELEIWNALLGKDNAELDSIINTCFSDRLQAEQCFRNNLSFIHDEILQLEVTYRALETFFVNAGDAGLNCLTLINARKSRLNEYDCDDCVAIRNELKKYYDTLSLKNSYSLLVIPGYLGDASTLRRWADVAYNNKVILVTDFKNCDSFRRLKEELLEANLQGSDTALANAIMTCNYLVGRKKSEQANESDDVYLPGSGALAGRMANTNKISIAQGVVGKEYGTLDGAKDSRLPLLKSEIALLISYGVIPIVENDGHIMAFSNRSLYNGSNISLLEYPIVRMFDWVKKILMNYMHEIALEAWNPYKSPQQLKDKVQKFLSHYQMYENYFSKYKLGDPVQDPKTKIVTLDLLITPYYAAKNFIIKLEADNKGHTASDTTIEQDI